MRGTHIQRDPANAAVPAKTFSILGRHKESEYGIEIILGISSHQTPEAKPKTWHSICGVKMDLIGYEAADFIARWLFYAGLGNHIVRKQLVK